MAGRPRDPDLERRLLRAAWSVLITRGYDSLTLSQVATEANAHRSDVYRRWPNKVRLVAAALTVHLPPVSEFDTGALRTDLRAYVDDLSQSWSSPWIDGLVGVIADLRGDPEADQIFRAMGERRGKPLRQALVRAVERGDIQQPPDLFLVGDLLEGPLMHRRLFGHGSLPPEFLEAVAESAYRALSGKQALSGKPTAGEKVVMA